MIWNDKGVIVDDKGVIWYDKEVIGDDQGG